MLILYTNFVFILLDVETFHWINENIKCQISLHSIQWLKYFTKKQNNGTIGKSQELFNVSGLPCYGDHKCLHKFHDKSSD